MPDPRVEAVTAAVARVEGVACWLSGVATRAALAGGVAGLVLWWFAAGERVSDWWQGTAVSVLVLALCLAPALWLVNVRAALIELIELPDRLRGVARRRAGLRPAPASGPKPPGGLLGAVRALRGVLRDYGDVVGSWGTVAQLVVPSFWLLTVAALAAVPVVALVAAVVALVDVST
ncbi:MAG: hypothetical protein M3203_08080 [Actinomycetota bacterium]|nr:hypothetical protein [Actinomycetota bacterium]